MRRAAAIGALRTVMATGLCTRKTGIHALCWAKLELSVGPTLSRRHSLNFLGGVLQLRGGEGMAARRGAASGVYSAAQCRRAAV